jgi:hypothetical protein
MIIIIIYRERDRERERREGERERWRGREMHMTSIVGDVVAPAFVDVAPYACVCVFVRVCV